MGRTAFYTQAQYDNHTALIHKEDAARVRGIIRERELPDRQREEAAQLECFRASERAVAEARQREQEALEAAIAQREAREDRQRLQQSQRRGNANGTTRPTATERAAAKARATRFLELSKPKERGEAMYGSGTYGYVMHQHGHEVVFPEGRNHAPYCPGVDRHRIVPNRPDLAGSLPPWIGSYSSHHGAESEAEKKKAAKAEEQFFLAASRRPAGERQARSATVAQLEADQQARRERELRNSQSGAAAPLVGAGTHDETAVGGVSTPVRASRTGRAGDDTADNDDDDDVPSIFSHASSHGAVADTGCRHMGLQSTKPEVRQHLANGGAASLRASRGPTTVTDFESLTLPELTMRIARMQRRTA